MAAEQAVVDERVFELATTLGYDGALTVGGIEDEIRFYQKVTVEGMLRLGKLLLLLKEAAPHGEFESRLELLGFGLRSAQNFMAAAKKVSKSASAALLVGHVKDRKAFLELITHDDGVIESLASMDEFDKMSASQLRAKARELEREKNGFEKVNADLHHKMDSLKAKHAGKKLVATDWPDAFKGLMDQAHLANKNLQICIGSLVSVAQEALKAEPAGPDEEQALERARAALAEDLRLAYRKSSKFLEESTLLFDKTLGAFCTESVYA
jgi:hypothetical protein